MRKLQEVEDRCAKDYGLDPTDQTGIFNEVKRRALSDPDVESDCRDLGKLHHLRLKGRKEKTLGRALMDDTSDLPVGLYFETALL